MLASACSASSGGQNQPLAPEAAQAFEEKVSRIAGQILPGATVTPSVLPGIGLAEGISEITGVAISPLLGVSFIGAWKYWRTASSSRAQLPWYCQPWAWGTGLGILCLCFLKDLFGSVLPGIFKKPLDWLELFENKASALVASTAFVPLVALAMSEYQRIEPEQAGLMSHVPGLAQAPMTEILASGMQAPWISIPLSLVLFAVVWLSSHAIHVLIALSPFGLVDSALKLVKMSILSLVAGCGAMISSISPVPAMLACLMITLISALLAGWSYRLLVFGCVMVGDLLFRRQPSREESEKQGIAVFLSRPLKGLPARTYGRLHLSPAGDVVFTRHLSLKPVPQVFVLPVTELLLQKGFLYPTLSSLDNHTRSQSRLAYLLPRYRGHEAMAASTLAVHQILENPLIRGCRSMKRWLVDLASGQGEPLEAGPS
ncbi:MAG: hypothetical protein CJBNEKGG_00798 [Prosthecobacter sp.]|nr:hypothetical protein [Prosthecobacter sp.]